MTQEYLAEASGLDRSYVDGIEGGKHNPALTAILRLASALGVSPSRLFDGISGHGKTPGPGDGITAVARGNGLVIRFMYDQYDAEYQLQGATRKEFNRVVSVLKKGLVSGSRRADVVADMFLKGCTNMARCQSVRFVDFSY